MQDHIDANWEDTIGFEFLPESSFVCSMAFNVVIQFGKDSHKLELGADAGVEDVQRMMEEKLGIIARRQKLIYKGKVLQSGKSLVECGVKKGAKIMLLSSVGAESRVRDLVVAVISVHAMPFGWIGWCVRLFCSDWQCVGGTCECSVHD